MQVIKLRNDVVIGDGRLVLLAGPCMAETLEVCLETGAFLKDAIVKTSCKFFTVYTLKRNKHYGIIEYNTKERILS